MRGSLIRSEFARFWSALRGPPVGLRWIVGRIGRWKPCSGGFLPDMKLVAEGANAFGFNGRAVPFFFRVRTQVEELERAVFEPLDELPIAAAHARTGCATLVAIVRIMPEESALGQRFSG